MSTTSFFSVVYVNFFVLRFNGTLKCPSIFMSRKTEMNFLATNFPKTCTVVLVTSNSINDITSVMDTVDMISDVMKQTPLAIWL